MKRFLKSVLAIALCAAMLCSFPVFVSAETGYDRGYTGSFPGTGKIVSQGLDVSSWQGSSLDFKNIKNAGYSYVILRCGTSNGKDTCFETYYKNARSAGLDIGTYYYSYATTVSAAKTDLANIKSWISGKTFEYPVYFDYEDPSQQSLGATAATNICRTVMDGLRDAGYLVGFYSMKSWISQSWISSSGIKSTYEGWVAHYVSATSDGGYSTYSPTYCTQYGMYQYTSSKYVNGKGPYDANVCYKDYPSIVKKYGFNGYSVDNTFTFKFYANGGEGTMDNQKIEKGVSTAISANKFTREGYTFAGWRAYREATKQYRYTNGTDSAWYTKGEQPAGYYYYLYKDGQKVSATGKGTGDTVRMYAYWAKQDYIVKYFADGGEGTMEDTTHTYGVQSALAKNTFTRSGYTFAGWRVERVYNNKVMYSDATEKTGYVPGTQPEEYFEAVYADQNIITTVCGEGVEVHCHAKWQPVSNGTTTYYVEFNANGGEGTMPVASVVYGTSTKIPANEFTREGYTFKGWRAHRRSDSKWVYEDSAGTDKWMTPEEFRATEAGTYTYKVYNDKSSIAKTSKVDCDVVTMYAIWEAAEYTVVFKGMDGTTLSTQTVKYGEAATAPTVPEVEGYHFNGWDTAYDVITGDTTITAVYGADVVNYTVTFKDDNGIILDTQTVQAGNSAVAPADPIKAADVDFIYTFAGWDKSFAGITADTVVTATYTKTPQVYYIRGSFNNWETTNVMTSAGEGLYKTVVTIDAGVYEYKAANADYTMEWPLGYNGSFELARKSDVTFILDTDNHTVTITPEFVEFIVEFEDYNGTVLSTQYVEKGQAAQAPAEPAREGYEFVGWDEEYNNITEDIVVTAKYSKIIVVPTHGSLKIQVLGGTGFTIAMNDGAARPQSTFYLNSKAPIGTKVTVTAQNTGSEEFIGWVNPANNQILSTDVTYTFYTGGNDSYRAIYKTVVDDVNIVTFKNNKSNQILDMQYYTAGDEIVFPDAPEYVGYTFTGWDHTEAEIQAKLKAGQDVVINPNWEIKEVYVSVNVTNGSVVSHGGMNGNGQYLANRGMIVEAYAAESGKKFAFWADSKGKIKSYDVEYKFWPAVDTDLTAIYVDEDTTIEYDTFVYMESCDTSGTYGTFNFSWFVPEKYTFMASGLIAINQDYYKEDTFYHGTTDTNVWDRSAANATASGTYNWTGPVMGGQTWFAKAWVQYADADGNVQTVYSDMLEVVKY